VSEAEKLNASSQNALLKVLEEPPSYCTIILLCTRLEKLLPTTKSRCQLVRFNQIDEEKIISHLTSLGLDAKRSTFFARFADGSIGLAETYAKLELESQKLFEMKTGILNTLSNLKYEQCLDAARELGAAASDLQKIWTAWDKKVSSKDLKRRSIGFVINVVISVLRDAMKNGLDQNGSLINADQKQIIQKLSGKYNSEQAAEKIEDCFENMRWLEASVNEKLLFERLLLNLEESVTMQA
jgi:DNA polymerase-3 subunit delta'